MKHNVLRFGTTLFREKDSIAIEALTAVCWATQTLAFCKMTIMNALFSNPLRLDNIFAD